MRRTLLLAALTVGVMGCTNALAPTVSCTDNRPDRPALCAPEPR